MSLIRLEICRKDGTVYKAFEGEDEVYFDWPNPYEPGDYIRITASDVPLVTQARLDQALSPSRIYLAEKEMIFPIRDGQELLPYGKELWPVSRHWGFIRKETPADLENRINLACNSMDYQANQSFYPHCSSNVEMDNPQFYCWNVIDGICVSARHGSFSYSSWSLGQKEEPRIVIDFGREVLLDEIRVFCRAQFPHDGWFHSCTITLDDHHPLQVKLEKTGKPQSFRFNPQAVSRVVLSDFECDTSVSPFTALTQIECWGKDKTVQK